MSEEGEKDRELRIFANFIFERLIKCRRACRRVYAWFKLSLVAVVLHRKCRDP